MNLPFRWTVCDEESGDIQACNGKFEYEDCNHQFEKSTHFSNDRDIYSYRYYTWFPTPEMLILQIE
jgi:hypothetical protein